MAGLPLDEAKKVVAYWHKAGETGNWFRKDPAFDRDFRKQFLHLHEAAVRRELDHWAETAEGALALLILLDQFPRNAFRGTARMYATDELARWFARDAQRASRMQEVPASLRLFFCLPFAHSEQLADQDVSVELNTLLGAEAREHAEGHRDIVRRFGHFPHRNRILGRESSLEEIEFLRNGGFAG
ncbi:DUF924 family protein [Ottowia thiooxydans]|uniref:DUF924 family protein n=1 Tax=Ottowia thiooxydans TaxID=219182 RepID=UPI00048DC345|nr:DUF924 family protein [Ottowia thiooxydans]